MFRKFLFWSHLVVGISIGIIVFIMSATGVLLTYEKQILEWDESRHTVISKENQQRLTTDQILNIARKTHPNEKHIYIRWVKGENQAVPLWAGAHNYLISPYTGEIIQTGESWIVEAIHFTTELHRWLAIEGTKQPIAKAVTAYSNLLFLFLIISGAYLWLPRRIRWSAIKTSLLFKSQYKSHHAKHYNWHHVLAVWALIPLFFIVATATLFHFEWANHLLYSAYGEDGPKPRVKREYVHVIDGTQTYENLFSKAKQHAHLNGASNWHSMWLEFGRETTNTRFYIDSSLGNNFSAAYELFLDNNTGEVVSMKTNKDWSKGAQAWGIARFLHTGEYFGIIGQTIAGLASLATCFLVYTGFTLSWRRLITPYLRRREKLKS